MQHWCKIYYSRGLFVWFLNWGGDSQGGWGCQGSLEVIWSHPLHKLGHPELLVQHYISELLNISEDGDFTTSVGSLCRCSVTLTVWIFLAVQVDAPVFQFVPLFWILSLRTGGRTCFHPLCTQVWIFIYIDEIPLSQLFSRLNSSSFLSVFSWQRCCSSFNPLYGPSLNPLL